jgi:hypothetical protein
MQYPLNLTPEIRSNFDYIFLFADNLISNLKRIYDYYAGNIFPDFDSFLTVFDQLTKDYGCMIISNQNDLKGLDRIFWFRAV